MTENVLVLGYDSRSFLSVIRSLGRRGIKVHAACPETPHEDVRIALASRFITQRHELPAWRDGDSAWRDALLALADRTSFQCVIPCHDEDILALEAHREELASLRPYLLEPEVSAVVNDKLRTIELAQRLGIAVPEQRVVESAGDALSQGAKLGFPLIVKPQRSFTAGDTSARQEVAKVSDAGELAEAVARLLPYGAVALQRCVDGHGVGVEVLAKDGELLLAFQHERVHEPVGCGGGSSYRKSAPLTPSLLDATKAMLEALEYTGVGMFEFLVSSQGGATGSWVFLEINGRFWGSLPLSLASSMDFPWSLYQMWVHGKTEFPRDYHHPIYCRNTSMDVNWLLANRHGLRAHPPLRNTLPWKSVLAEARHLLTLEESNDTLVWDDPKPGLVELDLIARRVSRRVSSRLQSRRTEKRFRSARLRRSLSQCLESPGDVVFVCYGNICRSPMAEQLLRRRLPSRTITSCGFHERSERCSPTTAQQVALEFGIDLASHRSKHVEEVIRERPIAIAFVFDAPLLARAERELPQLAGRIFPLGAVCPTGPMWMDDPYGGDAAVFEACYRDIDACVARLATELQGVNSGGA